MDDFASVMAVADHTMVAAAAVDIAGNTAVGNSHIGSSCALPVAAAGRPGDECQVFSHMADCCRH